jgi:hypothetical protein
LIIFKNGITKIFKNKLTFSENIDEINHFSSIVEKIYKKLNDNGFGGFSHFKN